MTSLVQTTMSSPHLGQELYINGQQVRSYSDGDLDIIKRLSSDDDLVRYLESIEATTDTSTKYFSVNDIPTLHNLFFTAKTSAGAIAKIYRYMQKNNIPHFFGPRKGQEVKEIKHLLDDEHPSTLQEFVDLCHEWIDDFTTCYEAINIL